jgi:undecaprenyl diphosphate synthase
LNTPVRERRAPEHDAQRAADDVGSLASSCAERARINGAHTAAPAPSPDVDLLIRSGGEQRLSDFLLWECAYAEMVFTKRMWPDFDGTALRKAVQEFHARTRRFGGIAPRSAG